MFLWISSIVPVLTLVVTGFGAIEAIRGDHTAHHMTEVYFQDCFLPLSAGEELDGGALEPVTEDLARSFVSDSTARAWMARNVHVSLTEMRSKNEAALYGCAVQWHSDLDGHRAIDFDQVIQFYGEFLSEMVEDGFFLEIKQCKEADGSMLWVYESRMPESRPFRTVLSYRPEVHFLLLIAAESGVAGRLDSCAY